MTALDLPPAQEAHDGVAAWAATWRRALPALALVGPASWFAAALIRAAGIGTLDGGLDWISGPEGLVMSLGVSFFAATYILIGMAVASRAVRSDVAVTGLGLLGVTAFGGIAFFRTFMAKFTEEDLDPDAMNEAFEAMHIWDLAAVTDSANFAAWLVAGIAIIRTAVLPRWVGACCIGGVIAVVLAQGAYVALEVLWPLGTGLWLAATVGVVRTSPRPAALDDRRERETSEPPGPIAPARSLADAERGRSRIDEIGVGPIVTEAHRRSQAGSDRAPGS